MLKVLIFLIIDLLFVIRLYLLMDQWLTTPGKNMIPININLVVILAVG